MLPKPYDDDNDEITVSVNMNPIANFAKFDPESLIFDFMLVEGVKQGLHMTTVTLDDGQNPSYY